MARFGITPGKQEWLSALAILWTWSSNLIWRFQIHHGLGLSGEKAHYKTSEEIYMLPRRNNTKYMLQSKNFISGVSANFWYNGRDLKYII